MIDNTTIQIRKDSLWKYSTFILAALLIVGAFVFFTNSEKNTVGPSADTGGGIVDVGVDDDPVLGNKDAPVTIIEFSDYQCPFCEKFWSETLPLIKQQYIDTGKVKLVYRDFPLEQIHSNAMPAAIAVECVRNQGGDEAYWKMHDKIFGNQESLSTANLKSWAKELGYNIDSCLDSKKFESEVRKDLQAGSDAGVRGTPAFFINGKLLSGAQPFSAFKQAIDAELA